MSAIDHLLPVLVSIAVLLPGLNAHDLIAREMWPLTTETKGQEVLKKKIEAKLSTTPTFDQQEPHLGYDALSLADGSSATITLEYEISRKEFSILGMFHVDLNGQLVFFQYTSTNGVEFKVYVNNCILYIVSRVEDLAWLLPYDACYLGLQWYTISAAWKDKNLEVAITWARPNDNEGKKVVEVKGKDNFEGYGERLATNGELVIGSNATGPDFAVCCVRIYDEYVMHDHIEKQMYSNCERQPYWKHDAKASPCTTRPCDNSATCIVKTETDRTCRCRPWNEGDDCEKDLWTTNLKFHFAGRHDVSHIIPTIEKFVNVTVRSRRECATLCLQQNICLSFLLSLDSKCTLFRDVTHNLEPNEYFKYYISSDQLG